MTIQIFQALIESNWLQVTFRSFFPLAFLLVVCMAILSLATNNLRVIRQKTAQMTLSALICHPRLTDAAIWRLILPQWEEMVREVAFVLPDRFQVWIQPATPERAARLIGFGPAWVGAIRAGTLVCHSNPAWPASSAENLQ